MLRTKELPPLFRLLLDTFGKAGHDLGEVHMATDVNPTLNGLAVAASDRDDHRWSVTDMIAAAIPVLLAAALYVTYRVSPSFYLQYVLQGSEREHQAVELITFACTAAGTVLLLVAARRLWIAGEPAGAGNLIQRRGAFLIVGLVALATFFFAGEEISWGQSYFQWKTPDAVSAMTPETNLHNVRGLPISVNSLGSVFLIVLFVVLPIGWRRRQTLGIPSSWLPAIAEWPVVFAMLFAFAVKLYKSLYRFLVAEAKTQTFYIEYVEQINEQKEMLVAVALLIYAVYRVRATKPGARWGRPGTP